MRSEEEIKKEIIRKLRDQADRLEKGDSQSIFEYKIVRQQIPILEYVLELNKFNNDVTGAAELFKDRKD